MRNKELIESLGYTHLGSLWYCNMDDSIRIRVWKDDEVDFYKWSPSEDYQELVFRGKIYGEDDVMFVMEHCF